MTYIPRLFCGCGGEMKPEKIGQVVEVFVGHEADDSGRPYYKVSADLLICISCGHRILLNAAEPLAREYQSNYNNFTATHTAWLL